MALMVVSYLLAAHAHEGAGFNWLNSDIYQTAKALGLSEEQAKEISKQIIASYNEAVILAASQPTKK